LSNRASDHVLSVLLFFISGLFLVTAQIVEAFGEIEFIEFLGDGDARLLFASADDASIALQVFITISISICFHLV
jgi:hypothetical protein